MERTPLFLPHVVLISGQSRVGWVGPALIIITPPITCGRDILAQELLCIAMAVWTGARWELAPPRPQIKYKVPPGWKLKLNGKLNVRENEN